MKLLKKMIGISLALLFLSIPLSAQVGLEKVAQSTMNFLQVGVSPSSSALGEASCAITKGVEGILFNPASIPESESAFDMRVFNTQWISDINYMAAILSYNSDRLGSIGFSVLNIDYGTLKGTSLLAPSEISQYPHGYRETGEFSAGAYAIGLSYARAISTQFSIGATAKLAGQSLGQSVIASETVGNEISKIIFDAGVKYYTYNRDLWFGMTIRNFSSNVVRETIAEQLPLMFTMGLAMDVIDLVMPAAGMSEQLLLSIDFQHPNNYTERTAIGMEYRPIKNLALRGGYYTNHDVANWSTGLGFRLDLAGQPVRFDYSYSNMEVFKGVNRFSLGYSF